MTEEKILTQTLAISNHPIQELKGKYQEQYLTGLGEFLCAITRNDDITKFVFSVWCLSIIGKGADKFWNSKLDISDIKKCLSLHRDGLRFFNMRRPFLFDCFYLLEKSGMSMFQEANNYLLTACGFLSKKDLEETHNYFSGRSNGFTLPESLKLHRNANINFCNTPLRKVLVVATMSAGKSTLINALVGYKVEKVQSMACTNRIHHIYNKATDDGATVKFREQLLYNTNCSLTQPEGVDALALHFNSPLANEKICLIDTPGVNYSINPEHGKMTKNLIKSNNYDILLFVANGEQLETTDEHDLLDFIKQHVKRKIIIAVNKCDSYIPDEDSISSAIDSLTDRAILQSKERIPIIAVSGEAAYTIRTAESVSRGAKIEVSKHFPQKYKQTREKFEEDYYNLPKYSKGIRDFSPSDSLLSRTGINLLEKLITTV